MGRRDVVFLGGLLAVAGAVLGGSSHGPLGRRPDDPHRGAAFTREVEDSARRANQAEGRGTDPTPRASDLAILRRMSLALTGSIPSVEEIRRFEALPADQRLVRTLDGLLADRRTSDYLAERLARALVGTEDGPFLFFRRRRFTTWLSDALHENRRYDAIVRQLITETGLWTDHPATNFLTVTYDAETERPDPERLAARVSRAFLGVRLDCAQCHDHPFNAWKQEDFRGLAACFGTVRSDLRGLRDGENLYRPADRKTLEPVDVSPQVPFLRELQPSSSASPRKRLAAWLVDPRNPNLSRAAVNRFWAIMMGRPLWEPIDDLPTEASELPPVLTTLADDFVRHDYNIHRLLRVIVASEAFQRESLDAEPGAGVSGFPLTRLRPEQVAASIYQASSLGTLTADSPWFIRFLHYTGRNEFVRRYGDTGEDEFVGRAGTIPQRLLLLNGELVRDQLQNDLFSAASRIAGLAADDAQAVEVAYLAVLTRRPTEEEAAYFVDRLRGTREAARKERMADLFWALLNSTEFSWNH